jgi:hypothetical protein
MCHAAMSQTSPVSSTGPRAPVSPPAPVKASVTGKRATVFVASRDASPKRRISRSDPMGEDASTARWLVFGLNAALGIVGLGLWTRAPGFGVLYVLVISPAVIAMFVSLDRQRQEGRGRSAFDFVDRSLSILIKTFVILCLVSSASVCALCIFCFVAMFGGFGR